MRTIQSISIIRVPPILDEDALDSIALVKLDHELKLFAIVMGESRVVQRLETAINQRVYVSRLSCIVNVRNDLSPIQNGALLASCEPKALRHNYRDCQPHQFMKHFRSKNYYNFTPLIN